MFHNRVLLSSRAPEFDCFLCCHGGICGAVGLMSKLFKTVTGLFSFFLSTTRDATRRFVPQL